jgi:hypothetical protein
MYVCICASRQDTLRGAACIGEGLQRRRYQPHLEQDRWFLQRLKVIADMKAQTTSLGALDKLSVSHLRSLKIRGFSDRCVGLVLPASASLLSRHPLRTLPLLSSPLLSSPSRSPQAGGSLLRVHGAGGAAAQDTAERAALLQADRHVGRRVFCPDQLPVHDLTCNGSERVRAQQLRGQVQQLVRGQLRRLLLRTGVARGPLQEQAGLLRLRRQSAAQGEGRYPDPRSR